MTNLQAIDLLKGLEQSLDSYCELNDEGKTAFGMAITALELFGNSEQLPSAQPDHIADIGKKVEEDCISRQAAIDALARMMPRSYTPDGSHPADEEIFRAQEVFADCIEALEILPSAQPETEKYEYHYDHTDCIWYRPEARNRCPTTCAQYRDGWNDAMNYIFRDGKGYRPYRRDQKYEG